MADLNYYFGPWQRNAEQNAWTAPEGTVGLLDFGSLNECALSPSAIDQRGIGLFCTPRAVTLPSEYDLLDSGDCREIQVTDAHRDIVDGVLGVRIQSGGTLAQAAAVLFGHGDPTGQSRWKPLTPDRDGIYSIHLGGHSQIVSRTFLGLADPTWNKLRDLLRHDLQKHDDECKAESKAMKELAKELRKQGKNKEADERDARAAKVENHAEKVLDAMCRKYRCGPTELSTTIRRSKASTTISDAFGSYSGWSDFDGTAQTWGVDSGFLRKTSNDGSVAYIRKDSDLSSADHYAQIISYYTSFDYQTGVAARCASAAYTCYDFDQGYTVECCKRVAGVRTWLTRSATLTPSSGQTLKVNCSGSSITWSVASYSANATDTAISSGVRGGVRCSRTGTGAYAQKFDDFYATDGIADGHAPAKPIGGLALNGPFRRVVFP